MKDIIKRVLCVVLVAMLLCSLMTMTAFAIDVEPDTVAIVHYTSGGVEHNDEYSTLDSALAAAYRGDVVYLIKSAPLSDIAEVKSGITLVVTINGSMDSTDDLKTGVNNIAGNGSSTDETQKPSVTLTVPDGKVLTVNGTLIVAGNQQSTTGRSGFRTGDYGAIDLEGELIVNGSLYARGKIEGAGTVTANKGSAVYERFEISDWRGGNASEDAFNKDVFPFNLYELGGIDSKLVLNAGTTLFGQSFIYSSTFRLGASLNVPYISSTGSESSEYNVDGAIISFKESDDNGTVTFTRSEGVSTITLENAEIETGNITYVVRFFGIPVYNFSSKNTDCPFGYKTNVVLKNTAVDVNTRIKFLPGSSFTVGADSTLNITANGAMYFYAADTYQTTYCQSIPSGWDVNLPAVLQVDGGTVINNGTLASSSDTLDNIKGLDNKTLGAETSINEALQGDRSVTLVPVTFYKVDLPTPAE